jgi:hypothetical protein
MEDVSLAVDDMSEAFSGVCDAVAPEVAAFYAVGCVIVLRRPGSALFTASA